nr:hypothetical protein [Tanacetum cinerariifolium]
MAFVSTPSTSNNDDVSTIFGVSTASPQVSTTNLSDATVYDFLANQPNRSQLMHEDLEQIHEDDLEEIDLKGQLALLSMRANIFFQKTGKKITNNGSDIAGYDKAKVECFNSHKMRHFAREYTSSKAMVAIDGAGLDWSYMADDEAPTNMTFMAFSDSALIILEPVKENNDAPLIEDWESKGEDEVESPLDIERKTVKPSVDNAEVDIPKQNDKNARRLVKYAEMYRTQRPRGSFTQAVRRPRISIEKTISMVEFDIGQEDDKFWRTASAKILDNREIELNATVDGQDKTITEASVRRHLKLAYADVISTLPTTKILEQLALIGYVTNSDKLT